MGHIFIGDVKMYKTCLLALVSTITILLGYGVYADNQKTLWDIDLTGVCRDNNGSYPRWSDYNWSLSQCLSTCKENNNCQGFAMHKSKEYCQLFGSDGALDASQPAGNQITRGDSSQPEYMCFLKNPIPRQLCNISGHLLGGNEYWNMITIGVRGPDMFSKHSIGSIKVNRDGYYSFAGIPQGKYKVYTDIRADLAGGFKPVQQIVDCKGSLTGVDFHW